MCCDKCYWLFFMIERIGFLIWVVWLGNINIEIKVDFLEDLMICDWCSFLVFLKYWLFDVLVMCGEFFIDCYWDYFVCVVWWFVGCWGCVVWDFVYDIVVFEWLVGVDVCDCFVGGFYVVVYFDVGFLVGWMWFVLCVGV